MYNSSVKLAAWDSQEDGIVANNRERTSLRVAVHTLEQSKQGRQEKGSGLPPLWKDMKLEMEPTDKSEKRNFNKGGSQQNPLHELELSTWEWFRPGYTWGLLAVAEASMERCSSREEQWMWRSVLCVAECWGLSHFAQESNWPGAIL